MEKIYCIKSKEEMEKEYGLQWEKKIRPFWTYQMNKLFGHQLTKKESIDFEHGQTIQVWDKQDRRNWFVSPAAVKVVEPIIEETKKQRHEKCAPRHKQVILIIDVTKDGTLTVNYAGYEGVAKCHPDDEFDYRKGMAIALHRIALQLGEYEVEKEKTIVVKERVKTNILDEI